MITHQNLLYILKNSLRPRSDVSVSPVILQPRWHLLACDRLPYHVHGIVWLRRVLVFIVKAFFLQFPPHFSPFLFFNASEQIQKVALLHSVRCWHKHAEL